MVPFLVHSPIASVFSLFVPSLFFKMGLWTLTASLPTLGGDLNARKELAQREEGGSTSRALLNEDWGFQGGSVGTPWHGFSLMSQGSVSCWLSPAPAGS